MCFVKTPFGLKATLDSSEVLAVKLFKLGSEVPVVFESVIGYLQNCTINPNKDLDVQIALTWTVKDILMNALETVYKEKTIQNAEEIHKAFSH